MAAKVEVVAPLLAGGDWITTAASAEVRAPYDRRVVARVSAASAETVANAVAVAASVDADAFPASDRADVLDRAAALVARDADHVARLIATEVGKPLKQARVEASRAMTTLRFSAVAARTLAGEAVPLDAAPSGHGKIGFTLRVPLGVVAAITPFNFPVNLVAHKVGPALAAGNAVVIKPAPAAPLSALRLAELLLEAGLPPAWLHVLPGGAETGAALVDHPDVAAISFTGSVPVGWSIRARAPQKKVVLELGSTAPLIIDETADLERAAAAAAPAAFSYAGQSCISIQRLLVAERVADAFVERFLEHVGRLVVGDPLDERTDVGPLVDEANLARVRDLVDSAVAAGATLLAGGSENTDGTFQPTVLLSPPHDHDVWRTEAFGPLVVVERFRSFDDAIELANDAAYGLHAGVFTASLERALTAAKRLQFGGVVVNDVPTTRVDNQPYGGVKDSGNTREGPMYAARELSEERFVSLQP